MEKINAVLVLLGNGKLESTLEKLNLNNVNLIAVAADDMTEKYFRVDNKKIPTINFSALHQLPKKYKNYIWLIAGSECEGVDAFKMKKFLMTLEVSEDNIVNLSVPTEESLTWLANLRYVEEYGADFFATGNELMQRDLNLKYIPCVIEDKAASSDGVNLANANQDLRQSFLTAKHVFDNVKPSAVKFVLIGLTPDSLCYDNSKDFKNCTQNLTYLFALNDIEENIHDRYLKALLSDDVKDIFAMTTSAQADLNFDDVKKKFTSDFSIKAVTDWEDDSTPLTTDAVEANTQILKEYIELCLDNGAKPVGLIFPSAPVVRKNYNAQLLKNFREIIAQLEENYDFICVDLFDRFNYNCFCDMTHLNSKGTMIANALLSFNLYKKNLIPVENFCDMSYNYFYQLSYIISKDDYNAFMERVFKASAQVIARKDKIKVGFVLYDTSMWCGDDLYNLFAQDKRFEPTVFLCLYNSSNELILKNYLHGLEQLKSRGLNVVELKNENAPVPTQDVLILLTQYFHLFPVALREKSLTLKTLMTYIPYTFDISRLNNYVFTIYHITWKIFFPSPAILEIRDKQVKVGMPRGLYSGYPKLDIFFKRDTEFKFDWKLLRHDAKKIIWAPHHSIEANLRVSYATFQWNYKFMYEFAKSHPETSWVVKPHPNLFFKVIKEKVFPSVAAFEKYLKAWDDLPNAQVCTGAYYQAIFATSDGMVHDSASFIAEYQYVDKPMIYLTRDTQTYNELGEEILGASYLVDGSDLNAIAAMIQRVIIDGDDYKAAERKAIFDKSLNYPASNGMLASEFIFKSIADDLI